MSPDECLSAAWTYCAPNRLKITNPDGFARGFWPDVARVAMAMFEQQTTDPVLDFRPTMCVIGSSPEPKVIRKNKTGIDLSNMKISL